MCRSLFISLNIGKVLIPLTGGGVNYIRWGRCTCPDSDGTELLYTGQAGGSLYTSTGGGANYLCLPNQPENDSIPIIPGAQPERSKIYGAEYETASGAALTDLDDQDVPCAVCYTTKRSDKIMIPGRVTCIDSSWTREYYGYLMTARDEFPQKTYECVDVDAEGLPDSGADQSSALFYFTEVSCGSLSCPPYVDGDEMPCVVCTK